MTDPDHIARLAQDFEQMNAPTIRRDRWREWLPVIILLACLALGALVLHVWPVAAGHIAEPFAGRPW